MDTNQGKLQEESNPRKVSNHSLKLDIKYVSMKHGIAFQTFKRTPTSRPEVRIYGANFNKRGKMTVTYMNPTYITRRRVSRKHLK